MKHRQFVLAVPFFLLLHVACERKTETVVIREPTPEVRPEAKTKTLETTRLASEVDRYEQVPSAASAAAVKTAIAELDGEIAELEQRLTRVTGEDRMETERKLANLRQYREAEEARFLKAKAVSAVGAAPEVLPRGETDRVGAKIGDGAKSAGEKVEDAARKVGDGIKDAADAVRDAVH